MEKKQIKEGIGWRGNVPGYYKAFGYRVDSSIPLPEALPLQADRAADVTVRYEAVDITAVAPNPGGLWWQACPSESHMLFGCRAGIFDIRDGKRIAMDAAADAAPELLRMFLLGSAMGAIQAQRGRIPIHAGAIVADGHAVMIAGNQGAGKSTMTSALVHNGFFYLTDDVSSVEICGGIPMVVPSYPQRKLVRNSCIELGYDPACLPVVDRERGKFAVRDRARWCEEAVPAGALIELIPVPEGERLRAEPVNGLKQLTVILRSLYRVWMHTQGDAIPPSTLKKLLTIASKIKIYHVYVPRGGRNILRNARDLADVLGLRP